MNNNTFQFTWPTAELTDYMNKPPTKQPAKGSSYGEVLSHISSNLKVHHHVQESLLLPSSLLRSDFPNHNSACTCPFPVSLTCPPSRSGHPHSIWWGVRIVKLLIVQCPSFPYLSVPLRPTWLPQQRIFKCHQPVLISQSERPSSMSKFKLIWWRKVNKFWN